MSTALTTVAIVVGGGTAEVGAMADVCEERKTMFTQNVPWNKSLKVIWRRLRGRITKRWSQGGGCKREMREDILEAGSRKPA